MTDSTGSTSTEERDSYDAWGKRRNPDATDDPTCSKTSVTTRGYTDQEMLDSMCLVNLNGRVYDPSLGLFISADDRIPDQYDFRSYNRYAYVNDNPLNSIDPSGHASEEEVVVTAKELIKCIDCGGLYGVLGFSGFGNGGGLQSDDGNMETVVVTAQRIKTQSPPIHWYNTTRAQCIAATLISGTASVSLDAIGLVPIAGGAASIARRLGNWNGYRGIVADQFGEGLITTTKRVASSGGFVTGLLDLDPADISLSVAGFIPPIADAAAVVSIGYDVLKTARALEQCS